MWGESVEITCTLYCFRGHNGPKQALCSNVHTCQLRLINVSGYVSHLNKKSGELGLGTAFL